MTKKIRVVIDTNLIMSAVLSSCGAPAKLIDWMTKEEDYFRLLISESIWKEYSVVADWLIPASRQKEKERILNILRYQADQIKTDFRLNVCSDESDNRFLECAVEGKADYLVTKNIRDFPHKEYNGVRIIRISKFLKILEDIEKEK